jgi:hypothetical protein
VRTEKPVLQVQAAIRSMQVKGGESPFHAACVSPKVAWIAADHEGIVLTSRGVAGQTGRLMNNPYPKPTSINQTHSPI